MPGLFATFEGRSDRVTTGVKIYHNSSLLFAGSVLGHGPASRVSFTANLVIQAGDTLDFIVDYGNGYWHYDTTQVDCLITVVPEVSAALDIRPQDCPNLFTVNTRSQGRIPMAILGSAGFNVADINSDTITIQGTSLTPVKEPSIGRVATPGAGGDWPCSMSVDDGYDDMMVHFSIRDLILQLGLDEKPAGEIVPITVRGLLYNGTPFLARDCLSLAILRQRRIIAGEN